MGCYGSKKGKVFGDGDETANVDLSTRLLLEKMDDIVSSTRKHTSACQDITAALRSRTPLYQDTAASTHKLQESEEANESSSEEEASSESEEETTSSSAGDESHTEEESASSRSAAGDVSPKTEKEKARKVADLVQGDVVVTGYVLKDEKNKPIARIGGMIVGTWEGQNVVVFLAAKHALTSEDMCSEAMSELCKVLDYWRDAGKSSKMEFLKAVMCLMKTGTCTLLIRTFM